MLLVDGGDDGLDEQGWVEKIIPAEQALRLMEPWNPDPDLCVIVAEGSEFLADPDSVGGDSERWLRCGPDEPGAREFWRFLVVDKADLSAR